MRRLPKGWKFQPSGRLRLWGWDGAPWLGALKVEQVEKNTGPGAEGYQSSRNGEGGGLLSGKLVVFQIVKEPSPLVPGGCKDF